MIVNGKIAEFAPMTLLEYLRHNKYNPAHVVVERNREIVTRERFGKMKLEEDDEINILQFMGGG